LRIASANFGHSELTPKARINNTETPSRGGTRGRKRSTMKIEIHDNPGPREMQDQFEERERRAIIASGRRAIRATYDDAGNCTTCGEAGRCPGYHAAEPERIPLRHANAAEVIAGRTEAAGYRLQTAAGTETTDPGQAARVIAIDAQGDAAAIFPARPPARAFVTRGKTVHFVGRGATLARVTIRQQELFGRPAAPGQLVFA